MRPLRTTLCALGLLWPALASAPASAQVVTASPFAARNLALDGAPTLAGLAVTGWFGAVGLRVGGALDVASGPAGQLFDGPPATPLQAWSAEADLRVRGSDLGLSIGGIDPGVFVGFGLVGVRQDAEPRTLPAWSYGADASLPLADWLSLDGEGRYRMLHSDDPAPIPGVGSGWELRAGLSVHLGRRARRPRPMPSPRPPRSVVARSGPDAGDRADLAGRMLSTGERYVGVPYA
nr:hypothetical protein [Gemmatimonadota bacterium]NIQ57758.1 hypothetical protein [Gemmatimonadota bacterium]NIU77914.1 hypothetical protein [Gammaproteobacteria bacterium]NIX47011.1 hypothetical protein [Gemmatimonadota bacterium]NIY11377.1 hypothetical protein [Gemmatimonadota bacterium]